MCLTLTEMQTFSRVRARTACLGWVTRYCLSNSVHLKSDQDLACGIGENLDCYGVVITTGDFGMIIITLGCHYSV
jgi:hypothetical protein